MNPRWRAAISAPKRPGRGPSKLRPGRRRRDEVWRRGRDGWVGQVLRLRISKEGILTAKSQSDYYRKGKPDVKLLVANPRTKKKIVEMMKSREKGPKWRSKEGRGGGRFDCQRDGGGEEWCRESREVGQSYVAASLCFDSSKICNGDHMRHNKQIAYTLSIIPKETTNYIKHVHDENYNK
eukprot:29714-Hanusia_phi.AAC.1